VLSLELLGGIGSAGEVCSGDHRAMVGQQETLVRRGGGFGQWFQRQVAGCVVGQQ
jgi:hypothetical protein